MGDTRELSVIIPALNAALHLPCCLPALAEGRDLIASVTVIDGGSADGTADVARRFGAEVIEAERGRGRQLIAGAIAARGRWLLFLHADTALAPGWSREAAAFMADPANARRAAHFRFALDDPRFRARILEKLVALRCRVFSLPYGDQGLLIPKGFYDEIGGYRSIPLMEDVELVRRIGGRRLVALDAAAITSAARYRHDGFLRRTTRNFLCLALYLMGLPPRLILRIYG